MEQELSQQQIQTQTQVQTLAPQQIMLVRLLELPVGDLEGRVRNEMLENAALEEKPDTESDDRAETSDADDGGDFETDDYNEPQEANADLRADYASDDDTPDYLLNAPVAAEQRPFQIGDTESLYDRLLAQMGEHDLTDRKREILEYLIGSLDSDGLLRKDLQTVGDELAIYHYIDASIEELQDALLTLQSFEPTGIGARSLQECLALQLRDKDYQSKWKNVELRIIEKSFDDFAHKRFDRLRERYNLSDSDVREVYGELTHLNPRPGSALNESTTGSTQQVIPDFIVTLADDGELLIRLNNGDVPELRVSRSFKELLDEYAGNRQHLSRAQRDAYVYTKQKVDAAQSFINAIRQRQDTLLRVMRCIVQLQTPFFEEGDETLLKPMILKDVAERTGLDISTVSRVSNSKYVQTDFGVYPLKMFFNETFVTKEGEELSKAKIRATLRALIEGEDKTAPLSDDQLAQALKKEGYAVARRTVAKYREQMGFPVARLRR